MIPTFIYQPDDLSDDTIILGGPEAHHITSVLRLAQGNLIRMIDGQGTAHICEIISSASKSVTARIIKTVKNSGEPRLDLTLAIGLSTASKFDSVIEKATEAGVGGFIPLLTEKGKIKLGDKGAITRKMNRWRRVCEAAVKQSGRSRIPSISNPVSFDEFIKDCHTSETILFHPGDRYDDIVTVAGIGSKRQLTILVGPESGFSAAELEAAKSGGIIGVSLGPRVLRTETAGVVLPSIIIYLSETVKG